MTPIAVGLILLASLLRAWAVFGGYFFGDDFVFLSDVARGEPDTAWFFQRYNLHFMPLSLVLTLPVEAAGPFVWSAAATEIVAVQLVNAAACFVMLRVLFGTTPRILVPLGFYLFSPIAMPAMMWWAAALNTLTVQGPVFLAITAHVLYIRTGHRRWALLAALATAVGLSVYVKALLVPLVLGILTIVHFESGPALRRLFGAVRKFWLTWVLQGALVVAFLIAYFSLGTPPNGRAPEFTVLADLVGTQLLVNLATGLLGGPWTWSQPDPGRSPRVFADPPAALLVAALVLIVLGTLYVAGRYSGSLRPLWFLAPVAAATVAIVAFGRLADFADSATAEIRYWSDTLPYLTLGLALATIRLRGDVQPLSPRADPVISRALPRWAPGAVAVAYISGAVWSSITYALPWHEPHPVRPYVQAAVTDLTARSTPVELADTTVPDFAMPAISYPHNSVSRYLAPLGSHFRTPAWANDIEAVGLDGRPRPAAASSDLVVPPERLRRCFDGSTEARIDLGARTFDFPFWLSMAYSTDRPVDVTIRAGLTTQDVRLLSGFHVLTFPTNGSYGVVRMDLPEGSDVCVRFLRIGQRLDPR